jgi:hypothetical protein
MSVQWCLGVMYSVILFSQHQAGFIVVCVFTVWLWILLSWSLDCFHNVVSIWCWNHIPLRYKQSKIHFVSKEMNQILHYVDVLQFHLPSPGFHASDLYMSSERGRPEIYIYKDRKGAILCVIQLKRFHQYQRIRVSNTTHHMKWLVPVSPGSHGNIYKNIWKIKLWQQSTYHIWYAQTGKMRTTTTYKFHVIITVHLH